MNRTVVFQAQQGTLLQAQTMLLDEPNERLYVGAKNRLLSLRLEHINRDHKEVGFLDPECVCVCVCMLSQRQSS
jgi:hypothetical protein